MYWRIFNTLKFVICIQEASILGSKVNVLKKLQYSKVNYMYSRIFNTLKWGICTQEALLQWSKLNVLRKVQYIEVKYI